MLDWRLSGLYRFLLPAFTLTTIPPPLSGQKTRNFPRLQNSNSFGNLRFPRWGTEELTS